MDGGFQGVPCFEWQQARAELRDLRQAVMLLAVALVLLVVALIYQGSLKVAWPVA